MFVRSAAVKKKTAAVVATPTISLPLAPIPLRDTLEDTPPDQILEEEVVTEEDNDDAIEEEEDQD